MSLAERITRHYGGDFSKSQSSGSIPGDGHSRADRSVRVTDAPDAPDGLLVHCFNGADALAEKDRFRRDGLLPQREQRSKVEPLFRPAKPASEHAVKLSAGQRIAATFEYRRAGKLHYRKHRREPGGSGRDKDFAFDHWDEAAAKWVAGRGGDMVAYRCEQVAAADRLADLFTAEGEAKADKLASWGLIATSHKDFPSTCCDLLERRRVIILPDADDPGEQMAAAMAATVRLAGGEPIIIRLPGLADGGDILDWSGTVDELLALVDRAAVGETLQLADLSEWAKTRPSPKTFIVPGLVPEREVTLLTGDGGANKSTWGQQLATVAAASLPMLGLQVQPGPAMYITAEDHFDRLHWMHAHICEAVGADPVALVGRLHIGSVRGVINNELATFDSENRIRSTPAFARLKATLISTGAKLLVLDNVAHMFAGNESDRAQVTAFVNLLYSLCLDLAVTIILIAHRNKAGDSYSGSTAWLNAVRSHLLLERPEDGADPDERVMSVGKANYARPGDAQRFRWYNFALIRDEDLPADTREEMSALLRFNHECSAFLECLRARASQGDGREVGPSPGPNYAPTQFEGMREAKGLKKVALKRAMDALFATCKIKSETYRNKAKSRDVTVIREVVPDFPNAYPKPSRTPFPNYPEPQPEPPRAHTLHTTYVSGAANGSAAPDNDYGDIIEWSGGDG